MMIRPDSKIIWGLYNIRLFRRYIIKSKDFHGNRSQKYISTISGDKKSTNHKTSNECTCCFPNFPMTRYISFWFLFLWYRFSLELYNNLFCCIPYFWNEFFENIFQLYIFTQNDKCKFFSLIYICSTISTIHTCEEANDI